MSGISSSFTLLCSTVLYSAVLYPTVLYSAVPHTTVLFHSAVDKSSFFFYISFLLYIDCLMLYVIHLWVCIGTMGYPPFVVI